MNSVRARPLTALVCPAAASLMLAVASLLLAGCGVNSDNAPHRLATADLPLGLVATTSTTQAGPRTPGPVALIQVYFVSGDQLVARSRLVPSPRQLGTALGSLLAGPTAAEAAAGIRTAIRQGTSILDVHTLRGRAVINLSPQFADTGGPDQILALAQVVYTATSLPSIGSVTFELAGAPVAVPGSNGVLISGPVSRANYAALLAPGES